MASRLVFLLLSCGETSVVVLADTSAQQQANLQEDGSGKTSSHPPYPVQEESHQLPTKSQQMKRLVQAQKALARKKTWIGREPAVLAGEVEKQTWY